MNSWIPDRRGPLADGLRYVRYSESSVDSVSGPGISSVVPVVVMSVAGRGGEGCASIGLDGSGFGESTRFTDGFFFCFFLGFRGLFRGPGIANCEFHSTWFKRCAFFGSKVDGSAHSHRIDR